MRRRPFARVNSCGFACASETSATARSRARKAARAGTIATDAKIQLLFYSGSFAGSFFSPMLELSSKIARAELSWATRLRSGIGKKQTRLPVRRRERSDETGSYDQHVKQHRLTILACNTYHIATLNHARRHTTAATPT